MNIYFCGSIRAGRDDAALYTRLIEQLKKYGKVLTEHVGDSALLDQGTLNTLIVDNYGKMLPDFQYSCYYTRVVYSNRYPVLNINPFVGLSILHHQFCQALTNI